MLPANNALLWRLKHPDATGISYLFGTMHVSDERAFGYLDKVMGAISATEAFAAEFDTAEMHQTDTSAAWQLPNGVTLEDILGVRHFPRVRRHILRYAGLDIAAYNPYIPFIVIQAIHERFLSAERGQSLDEFLETEARGLGKRILGIESLEEQLEVLAQLPIDWQRQQLISLSRRLPGIRDQMNRLADMYARGDIRQIYQSGRQRLGKYRAVMLFQRNRKMAERIHNMAQEQALFAAVGAAHLAGKEGVLALLKARGWRCSPE